MRKRQVACRPLTDAEVASLRAQYTGKGTEKAREEIMKNKSVMVEFAAIQAERAQARVDGLKDGDLGTLFAS